MTFNQSQQSSLYHIVDVKGQQKQNKKNKTQHDYYRSEAERHDMFRVPGVLSEKNLLACEDICMWNILAKRQNQFAILIETYSVQKL